MATSKHLYFGLVFALFLGEMQAVNAMDTDPSPLINLPEPNFSHQHFDTLSWKDLINLASVSKATRQKIKDYFQAKETIIENAACPVLRKADLVAQLKGQLDLPPGTPDVLPSQRAWHILKEMPIYIDAQGLKWAYHYTEIPLSERIAHMPEAVQGTKEIRRGTQDLWGLAEFGSPKYGPMVVATCTYDIGDFDAQNNMNHPLKLYLVHEGLKMD